MNDAALIEIMAREMAIYSDNWQLFADTAQAAITALSAAGYVVVPAEATPVMLAAVSENWKCFTKDQLVENAARMYRKMIAAAAAPQAGKP